jgi:hypothetical protein
MKSFKNLLVEIEKIKPTSPSSKIPPKFPPKSPKSSKSSPKSSPSSSESSPKPPDRFEKSPDLGPKPYTRRGK